MTNLQHTPWSVQEVRAKNVKDYHYVVTDDLGNFVAKSYAHDYGRFIAAAPQTAAERDALKALNIELLQALRFAVGASEQPVQFTQNEYSLQKELVARANILRADAKLVVKVARAAIAKAEGAA